MINPETSAEIIADQIADVAEIIVQEHNDQVETSEEIVKVLTDAHLDSIETLQRLSFEERILSEIASQNARIDECLSTLTNMKSQLSALETQAAEARATAEASLTLQTLSQSSEGEDALHELEMTEAIEEVNPAKAEENREIQEPRSRERRRVRLL